MLKILCVKAAIAFATLPTWLQPEPCVHSGATINPDNSVTVAGTSPTGWTVTFATDGEITGATYNGRPIAPAEPEQGKRVAQVQPNRPPEAVRAELCGVLMTRASAAQARANGLRAATAKHDTGRRSHITAADAATSSARAEYNAACGR